MLRKLTALILSLLLILSLAACSTNTPEKTAEKEESAASAAGTSSETAAAESTPAEEPAAEPITLHVMWANENNFDGFEDFVAMYEKTTGNTVDLQFYPAAEYSTIITTKMMGGEGPDIFRTDGIALETEWPAEWFADLSNEAWVSRLTQGGKTNLTWSDGRITQAPLQPIGPIGIAYNKDTLAAAGITDLPATWDEFLAACEKLKAAGFTPVNIQLATDHEYGATMMFKTGWMASYTINGKDYVDELVQSVKANKTHFVDDTILRTTLDEIVQLRDLGYINDDFMSTTAEMTAERLGTGTFGFVTAGEWLLNDLADYPDCNVGIMPLPVGDDQGAIIVSQGVGMAANASSENLDAAKQFIDMWCAADWQNEYMTKNPGTPWFTDVQAEGNKFTESTTYWLNENRAFPTFNGQMGVFPEMESRPLMQELMLGTLDVQGYLEALDSAAAVIGAANGYEGW